MRPALAHPKSPNYKTPGWAPLKIALEGPPITTIDLAKFRTRPMCFFFLGTHRYPKIDLGPKYRMIGGSICAGKTVEERDAAGAGRELPIGSV